MFTGKGFNPPILATSSGEHLRLQDSEYDWAIDYPQHGIQESKMAAG